MKKVFVLRTTYTNDKEEVNGVFSSEEKAVKMRDFIKKNRLLGELEFKSSEIEEIEIEDDKNCLEIEENKTFLIL